MNRKYVVIILFGIFLVGYSMFVVWSTAEYTAYYNNTLAWYEARGIPKGIVDPNPYTSFWYGQTAIALSMILLITGICVAFIMKPKATTLMTLLVVLLLPSLPLVFAQPHPSYPSGISEGYAPTLTQATEEIRVNALLYFDEECTVEILRKVHYNHIFVYDPAQFGVAKRFKDGCEIRFFCPQQSWSCFWDSNDNELSAYNLLQEAIQELGGVYDSAQGCWVWQPKEYFDGTMFWWVDLLVIFTDQAMDLRGFSPPTWNALILQNHAAHDGVQVHEFSHQFWARHCGNFCVMNVNFVDITELWCGDCLNTINSNREKWGYKNWFYIEPTFDGSTSPPSSYWYQKPTGTMITIQAFPDEGYTFEAWGFYTPDYAYLFSKVDNPCTFPLVMDYYIAPIFYAQQSTGGSGGGGFHYLR